MAVVFNLDVTCKDCLCLTPLYFLTYDLFILQQWDLSLPFHLDLSLGLSLPSCKIPSVVPLRLLLNLTKDHQDWDSVVSSCSVNIESLFLIGHFIIGETSWWVSRSGYIKKVHHLYWWFTAFGIFSISLKEGRKRQILKDII